MGCEKVPHTGDPVDPELKPSVELSVTPQGVVPYGGSIDVLWDADDNTNKVVIKVNGEVKETRYGSNSRQGGLHIDRLFEDVLVTVVVTNVNLSVQEEKEIRVGDWTTSEFGLVSHYSWRKDKFSMTSMDGNVLFTSQATEEERSSIFYFHKDGKYTVSTSPGVVQSWYIPTSGTISINNSVRKLQVSQEEMVISYQTTWNGQPSWFNAIFKHASDISIDE